MEEIIASNLSKEVFKPTFIDIESKRYENLMSPVVINMKEHKRIVEEKDKIIQKLKQQIDNLTQECYNIKEKYLILKNSTLKKEDI